MVVCMRRFITTVIACILLLSIFAVFFPIETCNASSIIHVYSGESIKDAIDAANESDTVYVHGGTYNENLVINKIITLTGEGSGVTTINSASSNQHTIEITANSVTISGFAITNVQDSFSPIKLGSVSNCLISNNVIKNGGNGVYLIGSNSNTIQDNTIESNNVGMYFSNSDSNTIKSNSIQKNLMYGIFSVSTSTGNTIYLNDFSDNADSNAKDTGSNNWDYNSQGNYWDDYNDYDTNGDGIGDNPYMVDGGAGNQDNYPLGDFLSLNQQPVAYIDSVSPNPATRGQTVFFNGHGSDDGSIVAWEWIANGVVLNIDSEDFSTSSLSPGTYTIGYRVQDNDGEWSPYVYRTLIINLPNQRPTAYILEPNTPITKNYGESIKFLGSWSDDGQVVEFSWRSSIDDFLSSAIQFTKNNLTVGQHTIYFKVKDDYSEWSSEETITVTILSNPLNDPPVAEAGGPYTVSVNQSITFDGSNSYDPDDGDSITSYKWDFGDGSTGEGVSVEHTYTSEGNYTVELTVTDGNGEQTNVTTYVNIGSQVNGQNGGEDGANEDKGIPGFETIFVLMAIVFIVLHRRYKRI